MGSVRRNLLETLTNTANRQRNRNYLAFVDAVDAVAAAVEIALNVAKVDVRYI